MTEQATTLTSAAAARGPLAMEAIRSARTSRSAAARSCTRSRDVSFDLYRGAVVALVGESGSGKSTVARLLAGQERLTSGEIRLDGKPVEVRQPRRFPPLQEPGPVRLPGPVRVAEPGAHGALPPGAPAEAAPRQGREHRHRGRRPDGTGAAHPGEALPRQVPARAVRRPAPAGLRSPGRWPPARPCCWPTSRCPCWTSRSGSGC